MHPLDDGGHDRLGLGRVFSKRCHRLDGTGIEPRHCLVGAGLCVDWFGCERVWHVLVGADVQARARASTRTVRNCRLDDDDLGFCAHGHHRWQVAQPLYARKTDANQCLSQCVCRRDHGLQLVQA